MLDLAARSGGDVASSSSLLVKQPTSLLSLPNKTLVYIFELIYNSATWWSLPANRPSTLPLPLSNLVVSRRFYSLAAPIWLRTLILHNPDSATCTLRAFETAPQRLSIEHVVFYTTPEHLPEQLSSLIKLETSALSSPSSTKLPQTTHPFCPRPSSPTSASFRSRGSSLAGQQTG